MKGTKINLHDRLRALAQNLWWTWHPEVISLFTDLTRTFGARLTITQ